MRISRPTPYARYRADHAPLAPKTVNQGAAANKHGGRDEQQHEKLAQPDSNQSEQAMKTGAPGTLVDVQVPVVKATPSQAAKTSDSNGEKRLILGVSKLV